MANLLNMRKTNKKAKCFGLILNTKFHNHTTKYFTFPWKRDAGMII